MKKSLIYSFGIFLFLALIMPFAFIMKNVSTLNKGINYANQIVKMSNRAEMPNTTERVSYDSIYDYDNAKTFMFQKDYFINTTSFSDFTVGSGLKLNQTITTSIDNWTIDFFEKIKHSDLNLIVRSNFDTNNLTDFETEIKFTFNIIGAMTVEFTTYDFSLGLKYNTSFVVINLLIMLKILCQVYLFL